MKDRLAFVTPRFGADVVGGSEAIMREMAFGLSGRGYEVEILTTTAVDHETWESVLPSGVTEEDGIVVRRFETVPCRTHVGADTLARVHRGESTTNDEQITLLSFSFRVPDLFMHLVAHASSYRAVVFSPYLFWTTTVCMPVVAESSVVVPCLHDEPWARLEVMRPVLRDPAAVWFLSEPEHRLAHRLGPVTPRHRVIGAGVDVPVSYDADGFRERHRLSRPFILYAGRREAGKGWDWLMSSFASALQDGDTGVDLVTIGSGEVNVPPELEHLVIDLGFLPVAERDNAFAAACAYVQPSLMESFSRSLMESWLAGTPVLVRSSSEVAVWHCERSGGGRAFDDGEELAGLLRWLVDRPDEAEAAGAAGRRYVLDNYTWDAVLDRVEEELRQSGRMAG